MSGIAKQQHHTLPASIMNTLHNAYVASCRLLILEFCSTPAISNTMVWQLTNLDRVASVGAKLGVGRHLNMILGIELDRQGCIDDYLLHPITRQWLVAAGLEV